MSHVLDSALGGTGKHPVAQQGPEAIRGWDASAGGVSLRVWLKSPCRGTVDKQQRQNLGQSRDRELLSGFLCRKKRKDS